MLNNTNNWNVWNERFRTLWISYADNWGAKYVALLFAAFVHGRNTFTQPIKKHTHTNTYETWISSAWSKKSHLNFQDAEHRNSIHARALCTIEWICYNEVFGLHFIRLERVYFSLVPESNWKCHLTNLTLHRTIKKHLMRKWSRRLSHTLPLKQF